MSIERRECTSNAELSRFGSQAVDGRGCVSGGEVTLRVLWPGLPCPWRREGVGRSRTFDVRLSACPPTSQESGPLTLDSLFVGDARTP